MRASPAAEPLTQRLIGDGRSPSAWPPVPIVRACVLGAAAQSRRGSCMRTERAWMPLRDHRSYNGSPQARAGSGRPGGRGGRGRKVARRWVASGMRVVG